MGIGILIILRHPGQSSTFEGKKKWIRPGNGKNVPRVGLVKLS